jgi:hypothetical protein
MIIRPPYQFPNSLPDTVTLEDQLTGFDQHGNNLILEHLNNYCAINNTNICVNYHQILEPWIKHLYPNLNIKFNLTKDAIKFWNTLTDYNIHPTINYKNFICSFNGAEHVSRKLLVSILHKFGWFNSTYCSKNFAYVSDVLDGHIVNYVGNANNFYRKFFIGNGSEEFFQTVNSFGHVRFDHGSNIYNLETKLTESFLHIVSESMATSYYPFVTEKFLYSVVTRGLFLAYAQPGWHAHLEKYYGFRRYTRLFDYKFDTIENPVERLIELMSMISKFSVLSSNDWQDLYHIEFDTIEYNYDHYRSQQYLKFVKKYIE